MPYLITLALIASYLLSNPGLAASPADPQATRIIAEFAWSRVPPPSLSTPTGSPGEWWSACRPVWPDGCPNWNKN